MSIAIVVGSISLGRKSVALATVTLKNSTQVSFFYRSFWSLKWGLSIAKILVTVPS